MAKLRNTQDYDDIVFDEKTGIMGRRGVIRNDLNAFLKSYEWENAEKLLKEEEEGERKINKKKLTKDGNSQILKIKKKKEENVSDKEDFQLKK